MARTGGGGGGEDQDTYVYAYIHACACVLCVNAYVYEVYSICHVYSVCVRVKVHMDACTAKGRGRRERVTEMGREEGRGKG